MKQRIVAAIPNYNMGQHAAKLTGMLLKQNYDHVYVLDDCSTDNSKEVLSKYKDDKRFTFVAGKQNMGAGPTRNKILQYETEGIVHFMDADVEPAATDMPEQILAAFERHPDAAIIGLRVRKPDGTQYEYNFGPLMRLPKDFMTGLSWNIQKHLSKGFVKRSLTKRYGARWKGFWTYTHPEDADKEQKVEAVVECNMAVRLKDFAAAGAFAPGLRFHEIHHLALKLSHLDREVWYAPTAVVIKYDHGDVRAHRISEMRTSELKIMKNKLFGKYR